MKFHSIPDREKVLNCSIDSLELFSCSLSNEDETALSILDPVTITLEIKPQEMGGARDRSGSGSGRSCDQSGSGGSDGGKAVVPQVLEVEVQQLNFRLSYNDIKLFLAIAQSLPSMGERQDHTSMGERQSHREQHGNRNGKQKEVDGEITAVSVRVHGLSYNMRLTWSDISAAYLLHNPMHPRRCKIHCYGVHHNCDDTPFTGALHFLPT